MKLILELEDVFDTLCQTRDVGLRAKHGPTITTAEWSNYLMSPGTYYIPRITVLHI